MSQSVLGAVAYDSAGRLHTAFSPDVSEFWTGHETDSGWTAAPAVKLQVFGVDWWNIARFTVARDGPWDFTYIYWEIDVAWGEETALMHFSGDSWARVWGEAGMGEPMPLALVPHGDGVGSLALRHDTMMCDSEPIVAGISFPVAGLTYSAEDVPLVAWVPLYSSAVPVFGFKTNRWHTENIPGPAGIGGLDIETDTNGQVVIVYSTEDSGLWCARGTDVVGVRESPRPQVVSRKPAATVLSGASRVKSLASCVVFDAMGRRVRNPRSGILFVREPSAVGGGPSAVHKVVVAR